MNKGTKTCQCDWRYTYAIVDHSPTPLDHLFEGGGGTIRAYVHAHVDSHDEHLHGTSATELPKDRCTP